MNELEETLKTATKTAPERIEIPRYPHGRRVAVTLSFDDGSKHDRKLVEIFNALGLRATWNLNSGALGSDWCLEKHEVFSLFQGHEVAAHSVSHPCLDDLDALQIVAELFDDKSALEDLMSAPVRGLAYPYGNYSDRVLDVIRPLGFAYARTCDNNSKPFPWSEPLAWPTTCYQNATDENGKAAWVNEFSWRYDSSESFCFFVWGHAWEFEKDWSRAEKLYRPLSGLSDVWYATNIEMWDYERARQSVVIAANRRSAFNPSALAVTLKVDGELREIEGGATLNLA